MQEQNDHTLKDGLRDLPLYDPPEHLWSAIENAILRGSTRMQLPCKKQSLSYLPTIPPEKYGRQCMRSFNLLQNGAG
jgi:hypothetical protein